MVEEMLPYLSEWPFGAPLKMKHFPNLKMIIQTAHEYRNGFLSLRDLALRNGNLTPLSSLQNKIESNDISSIFFVNGRATAFTHSSLVNNAIYLAQNVGLGDYDRVLVNLPLWESFGQTVGLLSPFSSQSFVVIPSNLFNAESALKKIYEEKLNSIFCTPSQFQQLLEHPNFSKFRLDTLQKLLVVSTTNDRADAGLIKRIKEQFQVNQVNTAHAVDHFAGVSFFADNLDTLPDSSLAVGQLMPNMEAKVVDQSGKVLSDGKQGSLFLKGHNLFSGYLNNGNLEKPQLDSQGFFDTNLQASVDSKGFFTIF